MKYAMVLPDGAADEPVDELDGRTPLEVARTPAIDWVATNGRQGRVVTVPEGFSPGSDVATLSLFGYDPNTYYTGRAPLEAAAQGLVVRPGELVFRCNFVTIVDGIMADFTAGHIVQTESGRLIEDLNRHVADDRCRFHTGVSYRNLMVASHADGSKLQCTPPHDIPGQRVIDHQPKGEGANWLQAIQDRAHRMLEGHDVNVARRALGEQPVTDIWLWGQGKAPRLPVFHRRFGLHGAVIAAVDLIRGIARSAGMGLIDVPGATGYLDTDYAAKGTAAVDAIDRFDLVVVHIEAPDEAGHLGNVDAKITAIERIDEYIVAPLLESLQRRRAWRILIAPDHPTPVGTRVHSAAPPPFCIAGDGVHPVLKRPFSEAAAAESELYINTGHELMPLFLRP